MIRDQYDQYDHVSARARRATVRHVFALLIVIAAMWALALMGMGCSSMDSPAKRYGAALLTYDAANRTFTTLAEAGTFTDKQIVATKPLWAAADGQIAVLKDAWKRGEGINETALKSFDAILDELERWLAVRLRKE